MINWKDYIIADETILLGKPIIKGTRISVEHIINLLASGWDISTILENYPSINKESLQAVFSYLNECMQDGMLYNELTSSS